MRTVFIGNCGLFSRAALDTAAAVTDLVGLVHIDPDSQRPATIAARTRTVAKWLLRRGVTFDLQRLATRHGARFLRLHRAGDDGVWRAVRELEPELLLVAGCPWIFPPDVLTIPSVAPLNVHPSLLPRHQGLLPYPWIYYHDDRESGVTAHIMTDRVDEGAVLAQAQFPVRRGMPVRELDRENARAVPALVRDAVAAVERGDRGTAQNEALATRAPRVRPGDALVDFEHWPVERVWHFLAGLSPFFQEPLVDQHQRPLMYRSVLGFVTGTPPTPCGTVRRAGAEGQLACRDGWVRLGLVAGLAPRSQ